MADLAAQVRIVRRLHFYGGLNMLFFWFLMAIAYGAALEFRVFQLPTYIIGSNFGVGPLAVLINFVNTSVLVASFVLLTWIFHHIEAIWAERVVHWIRTGAQWLRWIEYSFSASVMLLAISLTSGVFDIATLLVTFATYNACMLFGGISEWHLSTRGHEGKKQAMAFYIMSCVMFLAAWVPTYISFFVTVNRGTAGAATPAFVYVIVFAIFALQFPFIIIFTVKMWHKWHMRTTAAEFLEEHGYKYECWYIYMSFVAKTVLAWTVFGAAFQQGDVGERQPFPIGYSEWILTGFLVGGFMWIVSALTYLLDQGKFAADVLGAATGSETSRRLFPYLTAIVSAARLVTIALAVTYMLDYQDNGWIAGLALGVYFGCEALYIPAADVARNTVNPSAHQRRTVFAIRIAAFIAYAVFAIVSMIGVAQTGPRVAIIVLGVLVLVHMFVADVIVQPRQVVSVPASLNDAR